MPDVLPRSAHIGVLAVLAGAVAATGCPGGEVGSRPMDLPALSPRVSPQGLPPAGTAVVPKRLTIAWTGEVRGEVGVCGCPTVPYGGFARREGYLRRLRDQGDPVFVLDAGDMLTKGARGGVAADLQLRASAVLDLSEQVGLDAWCPSATDLAVWPDAPRPGVSGWDDALAANVPGLPPARVVERDGMRVGVLGVSDAATGRGANVAESASAIAETLRRAVAEAEPPPDVWIALSNASIETNVRVAEGVPELGLVLATRGGDLDAPRLTKGAPILEAPDRGRFVSVVRLAIGARPGPVTLVSGPGASGWEAWDDALERLPLQTGAARPAEQARVDAAWTALSEDLPGRNLALVRDRPLGSDLDSTATDVGATLARFEDATLGAARQRSEGEAPVRYVAAGACAGCHDAYLAAWSVNDHAKAWQGLVSRGGTENPECVACHTTGWGEPGGNASTDEVFMRTWHAVQCEACHGPMSGHVADPRRSHGAPVTEATCVVCHDPANSPQFDFASYYRKVSCVSQKANAPAVAP